MVENTASGLGDWMKTTMDDNQWAGLDRDAATAVATVIGPVPFDLSESVAAAEPKSESPPPEYPASQVCQSHSQAGRLKSLTYTEIAVALPWADRYNPGPMRHSIACGCVVAGLLRSGRRPAWAQAPIARR